MDGVHSQKQGSTHKLMMKLKAVYDHRGHPITKMKTETNSHSTICYIYLLETNFRNFEWEHWLKKTKATFIIDEVLNNFFFLFCPIIQSSTMGHKHPKQCKKTSKATWGGPEVISLAFVTKPTPTYLEGLKLRVAKQKEKQRTATYTKRWNYILQATNYSHLFFTQTTILLVWWMRYKELTNTALGLK